MSIDRDTTRIVRSWLKTEEHEDAGPVLESVLERIDTTPQRRARWPARRLLDMNNSAKIAMAAAAVLVVAFLGVQVLLPSASPGAPGPTPSPTPAPSLLAFRVGPLEAGTYTTHPSSFASNSIGVTFTVPDGWRAYNDGSLLPDGEGSSEGPDGMAVGLADVQRLYTDPCHATVADLEVGPTVDDLVTALAEHPAWEASEPTDVTLGGYAGQRIDLQLPSDLSACTGGEFYPWQGSAYAQGPDNRWHLWIIDVEGTRVVVLAQDFPGTPADDRAEMLGIVNSIQFSVDR